MRHHQHNPDFQFVENPIEFNKYTERDLLQYCLGATLYMPGTKDIVDKILNRNMAGLTSMVMCCEDAIQEKDLSEAERNILQHLDRLAEAQAAGNITHDEIPLTFIRVRDTEQFRSFSARLTSSQAEMLSGFVFPKFYST
jgi:citrate lyase beta subunit